MKILLDVMGGDNSPDELIKGAVDAIDDLESEVVLIGNENIIKEKLKEFYHKEKIEDINSRLHIKHVEIWRRRCFCFSRKHRSFHGWWTFTSWQNKRN